jgi:hypothetical protein
MLAAATAATAARVHYRLMSWRRAASRGRIFNCRDTGTRRRRFSLCACVSRWFFFAGGAKSVAKRNHAVRDCACRAAVRLLLRQRAAANRFPAVQRLLLTLVSCFVLSAFRVGAADAVSTSNLAIEPAIAGRLAAAPRASGFRMEGWFVWCGAAIKVGDRYHLFASRWPEATKFPEGYRTHSEIVRASSAHAEGPYVFEEVVIGRRAAGKWDSGMAHNPAIHRVGDRFVLFYIGADVGSRFRRIGYATAPAITGPWTRRDEPLDLGENVDANNPAACFAADGSVKLMWRTVDLRVCVSTAPVFRRTLHARQSRCLACGQARGLFLFSHGARLSRDLRGQCRAGHGPRALGRASDFRRWHRRLARRARARRLRSHDPLARRRRPRGHAPRTPVAARRGRRRDASVHGGVRRPAVLESAGATHAAVAVALKRAAVRAANRAQRRAYAAR